MEKLILMWLPPYIVSRQMFSFLVSIKNKRRKCERESPLPFSLFRTIIFTLNSVHSDLPFLSQELSKQSLFLWALLFSILFIIVFIIYSFESLPTIILSTPWFFFFFPTIFLWPIRFWNLSQRPVHSKEWLKSVLKE